MDRGLLLKILGKEDAIKLEDTIYNLREITDEIRANLSLNITFFDDEKLVTRLQYELKDLNEILNYIRANMELPENNIGYTNSRNYIKDYIDKMLVNIDGLVQNIIPFIDKKVIYYNNMIADLVLIY